VFLLSLLAHQIESQTTDECSGESTDYQPGELVIQGKNKKFSLSNVEEVTGWHTSCSGRCESFSVLLAANGRKPKIEGQCSCCKLKIERVEVKMNLARSDGKVKQITKKLWFPSGCECSVIGPKPTGMPGPKPNRWL